MMQRGRNNTGRGRRRRGFTLVEAISTLTIIGVLGSVASTTIYRAVDAFSLGVVRTQLHTELSAGMDRVVRELQSIPATVVQGQVGALIESMEPTDLTFGGGRRLYLKGDGLYLWDGAAGEGLLVSGVTSLVFAGFDESNAALGSSLSGSQARAVRRVSVTISASRAGVTESIRTRVFPRGLVAGAGS